MDQSKRGDNAIAYYAKHTAQIEVRIVDGWMCVLDHFVHVLMRDEKEGRKKQARSNKKQGKATQHTQGSHFS